MEEVILGLSLKERCREGVPIRKHVYKGPELGEGMTFSGNHQWLDWAVLSVGERWQAVDHEALPVDTSLRAKGAFQRDLDFILWPGRVCMLESLF